MDDKIFRKHLVALLNGGQAFTKFENALENVKPELRNKKLADNVHSIWGELEHMRIAQEDILKYIVDPKWKSPKWPVGYWPKENSGKINDEDWNKSISGFLKDREKIIKIIMNDDIELTSIIPHTEKHTFLREILITAEHNAYHLGQILTVRKLLNDWD
ncbi:MAG TPA: DinB family protein [Ignavibacteriaceae bacterium]|nr:DinB family protein [Ignavibacteriaceae bacterium]